MNAADSQHDAFLRQPGNPGESVCKACGSTLRVLTLEVLKIAEEVHLQFCVAEGRK